MTIEEINAAQAELEAALRGDMHIPAIKAIRALTGAGLRESKAVADAMFAHITRVTTACEYRQPMPYEPTAAEDQSAHYVVISEYPDSWSVVHFRDEGWSNLDEAMNYAKGKVDVVNDVMVAKVIATTKRTLVTL
jgi:Ribosomal protein L7/L12 C-terminal domain.